MQSILDIIPYEKLALKPVEAAKLMNVSLPIVYGLIKSETANFPAIRIGNTGRSIIIPTISLLKWLDVQAGGSGEFSFLLDSYQSATENTYSGKGGKDETA